MDTSCNIWLEKLGSQVKRNPAWWSRLKHEEGQHSHSAALPPSSSLSRLPCSTSLCLYGVQALCNPPAWIAVLYLCQLPSRERKTRGGEERWACIWDACSSNASSTWKQRAPCYKRKIKLHLIFTSSEISFVEIDNQHHLKTYSSQAWRRHKTNYWEGGRTERGEKQAQQLPHTSRVVPPVLDKPPHQTPLPKHTVTPRACFPQAQS